MQDCLGAYFGTWLGLPCASKCRLGTRRNSKACRVAECNRCESFYALWLCCKLAKGISAPRISGTIPLTPQAIRKVGHRYQKGRQQPAGRPHSLDGAPGGRGSRKTQAVPRVGRETIRILLLSHDLKPWREKNVGRGPPR
jgi:hypothetical protein